MGFRVYLYSVLFGALQGVIILGSAGSYRVLEGFLVLWGFRGLNTAPCFGFFKVSSGSIGSFRI